jgi:ATPase subunit of ABC transporter with duplicated ATPase domains
VEGVLVIVSHDRELLELVDRIADLRSGTVHFHGGHLTDYQQALAHEQEATTSPREGPSRQRRKQNSARSWTVCGRRCWIAS